MQKKNSGRGYTETIQTFKGYTGQRYEVRARKTLTGKEVVCGWTTFEDGGRIMANAKLTNGLDSFRVIDLQINPHSLGNGIKHYTFENEMYVIMDYGRFKNISSEYMAEMVIVRKIPKQMLLHSSERPVVMQDKTPYIVERQAFFQSFKEVSE